MPSMLYMVIEHYKDGDPAPARFGTGLLGRGLIVGVDLGLASFGGSWWWGWGLLFWVPVVPEGGGTPEGLVG